MERIGTGNTASGAVAAGGADAAAREFWERIFARGDADAYSRVEVPSAPDPVLAAALEAFGDVRGRRLLDIGCGSGKASLFFASHGAQVTSIDLSVNAVTNLQRFCASSGITNVDARVMEAMDIDSLEPFDCVYGSMILHHIEPFERFAQVLRRAIAPGGQAFFWENHMASSAMRWFRDHCVGRFGIPKLGDAEEQPLSDDEIDLLRPYFRVEVRYPELLFFRLLSIYLLGRRLHGVCRSLDELFYRIPALRRFSYRQFVSLGPL